MNCSACPKNMLYGPCGGVLPDGSCEVNGETCSFLEVAAPLQGPLASAAAPPNPAARELLDLFARRRLVVVGLPSEAGSASSQRAAAAMIAGHADAALLGDAPWARVQLPPTMRASLLMDEGVRVWSSLNCRDRNRVALEGELLGLSELGVGALHCVTGDHPVNGHRVDAKPVFDLDSPQLTALAAGRGLVLSVAEAPGAPPLHDRALRAAMKAKAGADVCFVNHAPHDLLAEFIAEAHELAPRMRFIACVPLATSVPGLERLAAFAKAGMPAELATAVDELDPIGSAVRTSVAAAEALLELPGIAGVNLSAAAAPGEELRVAAALALAADELGGGS